MVDGSSDTDRSSGHSLKSRTSSFESWLIAGKVTSFEHPERSRISRAVKHSIDEGGSSSIAVRPKWSCDRLFIVPLNSGIFLIFEQLERSIDVRGSILADKLGRLVRDLQKLRFNLLSLLSCPIDGCNPTKLEHPSRRSTSSLGTPEKSGVLIRFADEERLMDFKFPKHC